MTIAAACGSMVQAQSAYSVNIGLCYPISNRGTEAATKNNVFSLHALAGLSRNEEGVSIAGLSNVVREKASGFQVAGFSNHVGIEAAGVQVAGFTNIYGAGKGLQLSGFTNLAKAAVSGGQVTGFFNKAGSVSGIQFAGFLNIAKKINGLQVAGFMNKAGKVNGVQLAGFLNIADSSDFPIGLVNLVKNGERSVGVTFDETSNTTVAFRSGGRVLYGILGVGYNLQNKKAVYGIEAGLGAHLRISSAFRVNTEAVAINLTDFKPGDYFKASLRVLPSLRLVKGVELFAGPTFNYLFTNTTEGKGLVNNYIWQQVKNDHFKAVYIGGVAGFHVLLR